MAWYRTIFGFLLPFIRPDRLRLALLALLSLSMHVCNGMLIWLVGGVISLVANSAYKQAEQTLLYIALAAAVAQGLNFTYVHIQQRVSLSFIDRVRGTLFTHLMRVTFPVAQRFTTGDLMMRLTSDIDRCQTFVINAPLNAFSSFTVIVVFSSLLLWIDWQLALLALVLAPLFFFTQRWIAPRVGSAARQFTQHKTDIVSLEEQTLNNLRAVSAFNATEQLSQQHRAHYDDACHWTLKMRALRTGHHAVSVFLMFFVAVVILYAGVAKVESGQLAIGTLASFLIYLRFLANPVRNLALIPLRLHSDRIAAERVIEVMSLNPVVVELASPQPFQITRGEIDVSNMSFSYPDRTALVFANVNVHIAAGECVALVGPSGAGKSTLANLLLRFYDPTHGTVAIDGSDIRSVSLVDLRQQISVVWQEPFLINETIRNNLLLANPHANETDMIAACRASFAWEFVARLPQQLDTPVTAGGSHFSAGQRQRLALAQAFLRHSPILILDEASSALDSHSEEQIVIALAALRKNRTTLIIAHRFSSIRNADRILYLNGDGSVTSGTHEQLMQTNVNYLRAVQWQTSEG